MMRKIALLEIIVETECKVICQAESKPRFVFRVCESFFTMSVTQKTCTCRNAEMLVDCIAYSRFASYADSVGVLSLAWVIVAEFERSFPKEVETIERVDIVSQIGCH